MPVIPHESQKDRWIISYVVVIDGAKYHRKVEFVGTLKEALDYDRSLGPKHKKPDKDAGSEGGPMFQMINPDSPECKAMVEDLINVAPVSDAMGELIRRNPTATIADVSLAYAKLLEWARENNVPFELTTEERSYKAADPEPFVEYILNIG